MVKAISAYTLVLFCLGFVLAFCCGCYPRLTTPAKLAEWSECDPSYISDWIGAMTAYKVQRGYPKANEVMQSGVSDCKGRAVIAIETLKACGYKSHIVLLSNPGKTADHVIAVFTMQNGKRGFIDSSSHGIYPESKAWRDIIADVGDGNWKAVFAEDVK